MVSASRAFLLSLQGLAFLAQGKATRINCVCTTEDCRREQKTTCSALMCYAQYFARTFDDVGKHVIRGCIDGSKSILCDNKRPVYIDQPWPVLLCCREEWCNRDVIPTAPPWLIKASKQNKTKEPTPNTNTQDTTLEYQKPFQKNTPNDERNRKPSNMINPIYISVPIAGACVLLAVIIFAIFLLKRKNQDHFYRDYNITQNANDLKHTECCNANVETKKSHTYPETERTSASSESKLLMKV